MSSTSQKQEKKEYNAVDKKIRAPVCSFFRVLFILIVSPLNFTTALDPCLVFSSLECRECRSLYYYPKLYENSQSGSPKFKPGDCLQKSRNMGVYEKIVYVRNRLCASGEPACDYTNLGTALVQEAALSLSYFEAKISFVLIGSPHFISSGSFPYNEIHLFKRSGFKITLSSISKEECNTFQISDCPERISVILKYQRFSIFISKELFIKNIIFDGADLYTTNCTADKKCCEYDTLYSDFKGPSCGLENKVIYSKPAEALSSIPALFTLNLMDDIDDYAALPRLTLEGVEFKNIYALNNETGWQVLIKSSELHFSLTMRYCNFSNNYFPLGIFKQMNFNEDPYFSTYVMLSASTTLYPKYKNTTLDASELGLRLEKVFISNHEDIFFIDRRPSSTRYPSFSLFEVKATFLSVNIFNFTIRDCYMTRRYVILTVGIGTECLSPSKIKNLTVISCSEFALLDSKTKNWNLEQIAFLDTIISLKSVFTLLTCSLVEISSLEFVNFRILSISSVYFIVSQSVIQFSMKNCNYMKGNLITFYLLTISNINFEGLNFSNINNNINPNFSFPFIRLVKIKLIEINMVSLLYSQLFTRFFTTSEVEIFYVKNSILYNSSFLMFLEWGSLPNGNITIKNMSAFYMLGQKISAGYSIATLLYLNNYHTCIVNNLTYVNSFHPIFLDIKYRTMMTLFENVTFGNITIEKFLIQIYIRVLDKGTSEFHFLNCNFTNILKSIDEFTVLVLYSNILSIKNCSFDNMSYNEQTAKTLNDKTLFAFFYLNSILIKNSSFLNDGRIGKLNYLFDIEEVGETNLDSVVISFISQSSTIVWLSVYSCGNFLIQDSLIKTAEPEINSTLDKIMIFYLIVIENFQSKNNRFFNLSVLEQYKFGAITFFKINNILINNTTFENSSSIIQGGSVHVTNSINLIISNSTFTNTTSLFGGAIFIKNTANALLENLNFNGCNGMSEGGCLVAEYVDTLEIKAGLYADSVYGNKGGLACFKIISAVIIRGLNIKNSKAVLGGVIYLEKIANITIYDIKGLNSHSVEGGFLYFNVIDNNSFINILNAYLENYYSEANGALIYSNLVYNLQVENFSSAFCKSEGVGIIFFTNAGMEDLTTKSIITFKNLICFQNQAIHGSCLYISEFFQVNVYTALIEGNVGSPITITSNTLTQLLFSNLILISTNKAYDLNSHINNLEEINGLVDASYGQVIFLNSTFEENFILSYFFKLRYSIIFFKFCKFGSFINKLESSILIDLKHSSLEIAYCLITNPKSFYYYDKQNYIFLDSKFSNLTVFNSSIQNCYTYSKQLIKTEQSLVKFLYTEFSYNTPHYGNVLAIFSSATLLYSCKFYHNSYGIASSTIKKLYTSDLYMEDITNELTMVVEIKNCKFFTLKGNSVTFKSLAKIIIEKSNFIADSELFNKHQAIEFNGVLDSYILECAFENYNFDKGAGLLIRQTTIPYAFRTTIVGTSFNNNEANLGGAIFAAGELILDIRNSIFQRNRAISSIDLGSDLSVGGAIVADFENFIYSQLIIAHSSFENNWADGAFGSIVVKSNELYQSNNTFFNNTDRLTNSNTGFSKFPLKLAILGDCEALKYSGEEDIDTVRRLLFDNYTDHLEQNPQQIVSGVEFHFCVALIDAENNVLNFDYSTRASLLRNENQSINTNSLDSNETKTSQKTLIENILANSLGGVYIFKKVKIITKPSTTIDFIVQAHYEDDLYFVNSKLDNAKTNQLESKIYQLESLVKFYVRPCVSGEILLQDNSCYFCIKGTYSLINPMVSDAPQHCKACLKNAYCSGGDSLTPLPGYWRASNKSALILKCPAEASCQGLPDVSSDLDSDLKIHGKCMKGHSGNLCYECVKGMGRFKKNDTCSECESLPQNYVKLALSLLFFILYAFIQVKSFSQVENHEPHIAICMKTLVNHFQTLSIVNLLDLGWTVDFNIYFRLHSYISFFTEDFLNIDCLLDDYKADIAIIKVVLTFILPIILSIWLFVIWLGLYIYLIMRRIRTGSKTINEGKFSKFIINKMRLTILVLAYLFYPEILRKSFSLMSCLEIDDYSKQKVLSSYPNIQCWVKPHYNWVLAVSIPGFLIWGVIIPLLLFIVLRKNKQEIKFTIQRSLMLVENSRNLNDTAKYESMSFRENLTMKRSSSNLGSKCINKITDKTETLQFKTNKKMEYLNETVNDENQKVKENAKEKSFEPNHQNGLTLEIVKNLGFLYRGYKKEYYYWEIVMFSRKLSLIFIGIFTEYFPSNIKATVFIVVIVYYVYFQIKAQPFQYAYLNNLETASLLTCFLTGNIGILLFSEDLKPAGLFFLLLVILFNIIFIAIWTHQFVRHGLRKRNIFFFLPKIRAFLERKILRRLNIQS